MMSGDNNSNRIKYKLYIKTSIKVNKCKVPWGVEVADWGGVPGGELYSMFTDEVN